MGRGGALVESMTFSRRVVGSTPALFMFIIIEKMILVKFSCHAKRGVITVIIMFVYCKNAPNINHNARNSVALTSYKPNLITVSQQRKCHFSHSFLH